MRAVALATVAAALVLAPSVGSAQDKYFDAGGVRLRYVEQGAGEPVVLVHGFTNTADIWWTNRISQELARNYRVIAFDMRGGVLGRPELTAALRDFLSAHAAPPSGPRL